MPYSLITKYEDWNEVCERFDDMGLHEKLLRGIHAYGKMGVSFCTNCVA